jgi:TM2 domain-containing membrane protein YozV
MNRGKQKVVAGILGILLGWLGVHHFYLGSMGAGVVCLLLSFCFGLGALLGIVEGILILVMKDDEFDARYNQREPGSMEFVFMKPS